MAAGQARRPARGAPRRARGDRHLLRRRHLAGARDAGRPHPPARRRDRVLAVARRRAAAHRGRVAALAVERPGRRAAAQRAPRASTPTPRRSASRSRPTSTRSTRWPTRAGFVAPLGADPGADLTAWNNAAEPGRALRRGRPRDPRADPRLPRRARAADRQGDHAAAHPVGLDRRPLPRRPGPADLRPAAPEEQDGAGGAAARRPRPLARGQPPGRPRGLQRPGPGLLRGAPEARGLGPRPGQRDRLRARRARRPPPTAAAPTARRPSRRSPAGSSSSATRPPSA